MKCIYTYIHVCVHIYIYMYLYRGRGIYLYVYIYICMYTHPHTHTLFSMWNLFGLAEPRRPDCEGCPKTWALMGLSHFSEVFEVTLGLRGICSHPGRGNSLCRRWALKTRTLKASPEYIPCYPLAALKCP